MALKTRFGEQNPIIDEIMSYSQEAAENLEELINMISASIGILPENKTIRDITNTKPLDQANNTIVPGQHIGGTIADEFFAPEGFIFKLPFKYQTLVDKNDKTLYEGVPKRREQLDPQLIEQVVSAHLA